MNTTEVQLTPEQIANFEQLIKQHAATEGVASDAFCANRDTAKNVLFDASAASCSSSRCRVFRDRSLAWSLQLGCREESRSPGQGVRFQTDEFRLAERKHWTLEAATKPPKWTAWSLLTRRGAAVLARPRLKRAWAL